MNPAALVGEREPGGHGIQPTDTTDTTPTREREPGDDDDLGEPS